MWAVDNIIEDVRYNNVKVLGLWAIDQDRNAWACLSNNIGWKRVASDNDNIFFSMLVHLANAKIGSRPINIHIIQGVIVEIYVL
jgi:hypothetical protein